MKNKKHIALWTSLALGSLVLFSGLVSFTAPKSVFYKGLEELGGSAQASVLNPPSNLDSALAFDIDFSALAQENAARVVQPEAKISPTDTPEVVLDMTKMGVQQVQPVCRGDQTPVIENGVVIGCNGGAEPTAVQSEVDAETIVPVQDYTTAEKASPAAMPTCESQNLFTYTGKDYPGLLYGMCIQCTTDVYLETGGKC